jgi:hypothetical protein
VGPNPDDDAAHDDAMHDVILSAAQPRSRMIASSSSGSSRPSAKKIMKRTMFTASDA